jgi:hypothetical protein
MHKASEEGPNQTGATRKLYQSPRLTEYGPVEKLTQTGGSSTADEDARKKAGG